MSKEYALEVKNVSKSFRLPTEQASGIKQAFVNWTRGIKGYKEQKVLEDVSFKVEKGDFFGIVGRNGSGKSTLLKLISQIYEPDSGKIKVNGKLVPFIELGVGFNPELTGRENVYLNGALLGFSHEEVSEVYEEIVEFAELEEFMDQKLKNYSSGMQVRLAFSIAIKADADILVLDEVLAVGDEAFQRKCDEYFRELKANRKTVILVTHSMESMNKFCNKAIMINDGQIVANGSPEDVSNMYKVKNFQNREKKVDEKIRSNNNSGSVKDLKIKLLSPETISQNEDIRIQISYKVCENIPTYVDVTLVDIDNKTLIMNDNTLDQKIRKKGNIIVEYSCRIPHILNDRSIRVYSSILTDNNVKLAYTLESDSPAFLIRRDDIKGGADERSKMALLRRDGEWSINEIQ